MNVAQWRTRSWFLVICLSSAAAVSCRNVSVTTKSGLGSPPAITSTPSKSQAFDPGKGSSLRVGDNVKPGQTFQVEFSGVAMRYRGREFTLYDADEKPIAVLLSDFRSQPRVGMDWYWSNFEPSVTRATRPRALQTLR